jgi:hypothetical protein
LARGWVTKAGHGNLDSFYANPTMSILSIKPAFRPLLRTARCVRNRGGGRYYRASKRTDDGLPVHGFRSLLGDLATVTQNTMAIAHQPDTTFVIYPQFTPTQARALELLNVNAKL